MIVGRPIGSRGPWAGLGNAADLGAIPMVVRPHVPVTTSGFTTFEAPPTGYSRGDIYYAVKQYRGRQTALAHSISEALRAQHAAGQLPNCVTFAEKGPTGRITTAGRQQLFESCFAAVHDAGQDRYATVSGQDYTEPVGVFVRFGVAFLLSELKLGNPTNPSEMTLEKTFVPTPDQRWALDHAVYVKSQLNLASIYYDVDLSSRTDLQYLLADGDLAKGLIGLLTRDPIYSSVSSTASLNDFIKGAGDQFTYHVDGYGMNPIVPTDEELNGSHGAYEYYKRGGFLLDKAVVNGQDPVAHGELAYTTGYCWIQDRNDCPLGPSVAVPSPRPIPMRDIFWGGNRGWLTFIKITPKDYTLRVQAKERGTASKIKDAFTSLMARMPKLICAVAPQLASWNSSTMLAETCVDKASGAPCTKGSKNCVCTPPTTAQQAMVGVANQGLTMWCGHFADAPPVAPPPPIPPPAEFPWKWVLLGGGIIGALLLLKER